MFKNTDHISQKTHSVFLTRANGLTLYNLKMLYEINLVRDMQILLTLKQGIIYVVYGQARI